MELLRRNTDYAIRAMMNLGRSRSQGPVSTKDLATKEDISYQLACKLLQKLHKTRFVKSSMGRAGGFELGKDPSQINLLEIIETIQGPISLNKCLSENNWCDHEPYCPVNKKLGELQGWIEKFLADITLADLVDYFEPKRGKKKESLGGEENV